MRIVTSILLAICFLSVSTWTGYGNARTNGPDTAQIETAGDVLIVAEDQTSSSGHPATSDMAADREDECPCKTKSDSLTLTCGVTLALSGDGVNDCLDGAKHAVSGFAQTDRDTRLMYLLRRPPRPIL